MQETEIIKLATQQGLWAVLFVALLFYILKKQEERDKKSEEREKNYQDIIARLTEKFNIIEDIKTDVKEVKDFIFKK